MNQATAEDHKGLTGKAERAIADCQTAAAEAATKAAAAKDRVERIKRGDDVPGGLGKPLTRDDAERIFREAAMTTSDLRRMARLCEISDSAWDELMQEVHRRTHQAQDTAVIAIWRKYRDRI